jgi:hypothetical protein
VAIRCTSSATGAPTIHRPSGSSTWRPSSAGRWRVLPACAARRAQGDQCRERAGQMEEACHRYVPSCLKQLGVRTLGGRCFPRASRIGLFDFNCFRKEEQRSVAPGAVASDPRRPGSAWRSRRQRALALDDPRGRIRAGRAALPRRARAGGDLGRVRKPRRGQDADGLGVWRTLDGRNLARRCFRMTSPQPDSCFNCFSDRPLRAARHWPRCGPRRARRCSSAKTWA